MKKIDRAKLARESLTRSLLSRDSILLWTIQTYPKMKERYETRFKDPAFSHIHFVRLRSPTETKLFL
ncbi:MAG: hypothetical protein ABL958_17030, partial [Bdellovibrionia bacterium]